MQVYLRMGYRSNRQSGDRSRNLVFMGSLINGDGLGWTFTLITMAGMLTGAILWVAKTGIEVETRRSSLAV